MNRMETALTSLAGSDAEKAQGDMAHACNTYCLDRKAFTGLLAGQKPKIRKLWTNICWYWVKQLYSAYQKGVFDDRNKRACYRGYYIYRYSEILPDLPRNSFISVFIGKMARNHPTLQQSFSSLTFAWLNYLAKEKGDKKAKKAVKEIKKIHDDRWYDMPII